MTMKAYIITFQSAINFGAALQCVALCRIVKDMGINVSVIDYQPKYIQEKENLFSETRKTINKELSLKKLTKGIAKDFLKIMYFPQLNRRRHKFSSFLSRNVSLTNTFNSYEKLVTGAPKGEYMICGSDQIWNPILTGGRLDPAFFLFFAPSSTKKISYGVSLGEMNVQKNEKLLYELAHDFAGISVRERRSAKELKAIFNREISVVLDPTLLMEENDYSCMEATVNVQQPYVLLYNIQNSLKTIDLAKKLAKDKNLLIIDISPNSLFKIDGTKKIHDIGPGEFLTYVKNSDYVITNSFHGTIFSIIYKRLFYTVPHIKRSERMVDLLNQLELDQRIVYEQSEVNVYSDIDYKSVYNHLTILRENSIHYLKEMLDCQP